MLGVASLLVSAQSRADEPAGALTISRDIPGRNAFRAAAPGAANKVATAREDVVVASTNRIAPHIPTLPDSALDNVASRSMQANGALFGPAIATVNPSTVLGTTVVRTTGSAVGAAMGALPGAGVSRPLAPVAGTISSALGAR